MQQPREESSPPADWGERQKNIFHMQAAVNKPVKYLQACQGICNGDHSVAFECKSFCLGRQSSKVDAPGLLFSPRANPAIWLCWHRDLRPGRNRFLFQKQTPPHNGMETQFAMTSVFYLRVFLITIYFVKENVKADGVRCGIKRAQSKKPHKAQSTAMGVAFPSAQEGVLIIGEVG